MFLPKIDFFCRSAHIKLTSAFGASASASAYGGAQEQTSQQYTRNLVFSTGRAKKFNGKKINSNRFCGAQEQTSQQSTCKQLWSTQHLTDREAAACNPREIFQS